MQTLHMHRTQPRTMRLVTQDTFGGPDVLHIAETPVPQPAAGEVLVAVAARGVNPVDAAVRAGYFPLLGEPPFTVVWDIAGTVVAVDAAVTDLAIGDRVFGMPAYPRQAAGYADYVVARREDLAPTPANLDDVHAAALPLAGLTAHAAILGTGVAGPGRRVLVQAAGGGVGHIAVQLAKAVGAHVVATASPRKVDFVRALGADDVIDYTTGDWTTIDRVDLAVDPFAGENLHRTIGVVRDSGTVATLIGEADDDARAAAAERRITIDRVNVRPNADALGHLVSLVEEGRLAPHVSATFSLEQAGEAHRQFEKGVQGKVVLVS